MLVLVIGVAFGLAIGYFATQNTTPVTIRLGEYVFEDVPLYLVIVWSLFVGLFISWMLYLARAVSARMTIYGKDQAMRKARRAASDLELRVRELEAENADLKTDRSPQFEPPRRKASSAD